MSHPYQREHAHQREPVVAPDDWQEMPFQVYKIGPDTWLARSAEDALALYAENHGSSYEEMEGVTREQALAEVEALRPAARLPIMLDEGRLRVELSAEEWSAIYEERRLLCSEEW